MGTLVNDRPTVLVWIDAEAATLVRWDGGARIAHLTSEVPSRHEATGHVRHDPLVRHGGGGAAQDKISREREERIEAFLTTVVAAIDPDEDVEVLGPSGIRTQLASRLERASPRAGRSRVIETSSAVRLTEPQLVARLRARVGDAAPRVQRGPEH